MFYSVTQHHCYQYNGWLIYFPMQFAPIQFNKDNGHTHTYAESFSQRDNKTGFILIRITLGLNIPDILNIPTVTMYEQRYYISILYLGKWPTQNTIISQKQVYFQNCYFRDGVNIDVIIFIIIDQIKTRGNKEKLFPKEWDAVNRMLG